MGIIVKRTQPSRTAMRSTLRTALSAPPPGNAELEPTLDKLMAEAHPASVRIDWQGFAIALGIFVGLLGLSVLIDALDWVKDPGAYVGLASTALGAVLGFVTGEISGSTTD